MFQASRVYILLLPTLFWALPASAQVTRADSLKTFLSQARDTTQVYYLNLISEALRKQQPAEAVRFGNEALALAQKIHHEAGIVKALHNIGLGYGFSNDYSKTIDYLLQSATRAEQDKMWKYAANDYTNVGSAYSIQGDQKLWIEYYLKALKLYEKIGDKKGMASVLYGIGNSLSSEKKFDQALDNYFKAIGYFNDLHEEKELPKVWVNIGRAYEDMNDFAKALLFYEKAVSGFERFKNRRGLATALVYRAGTHLKQKQYDSGLKDLETSIAISKESNYQVSIVDALILKGRIRRAQMKYDPAIEDLLAAVSTAKQIGSKNNLNTAYELLAQIYSLKGDFKNAYLYQGLHAAYADSTFTAEKSKQIQEMQFRFDTDKKQKEIELLRQDKELSRTYIAAAFISAGLILIIAMLIVNRQRLKLRIERELTQKENQILEERKSLIEAELLNRKLAEDQLRKEIEFKNKEMTTYALNLIQKNELLDRIKESIEDIRSAHGDEVKAKLPGLLNTVNYSFHLDKDWETFKLHFEQVHQNFFDRLRELYPDLGSNDLKLCALIRLNLDTKALATVLDISPESAKVARHRLRKKLNLTSDQNLSNFLSAI